jgi:hypothetical protein
MITMSDEHVAITPPSIASPTGKDIQAVSAPQSCQNTSLSIASLCRVDCEGIPKHSENESTFRRATSCTPGNKEYRQPPTEQHVVTSQSQLRKSLPPFNKFCRGAKVSVTVDGDHSSQIPSPEPSMRGSLDPQMTQYISAIQSTLDDLAYSAKRPRGFPQNSIESIRQGRETVLEEALRTSITTRSMPTLRASLVQEVKLRLDDHLTYMEKDAAHARSILRRRGKAYWVAVHTEHEAKGNHEAQDTDKSQMIQALYSSGDRRIAVYYWALHQARESYAEIAYELGLPPGVLLRWVLQICDY